MPVDRLSKAKSQALARAVIEGGYYMVVEADGRRGVMDVLTGRIRWEKKAR